MGYGTGTSCQCEVGLHSHLLPSAASSAAACRAAHCQPGHERGKAEGVWWAVPQAAVLSWLPHGIRRDILSACSCPFSPMESGLTVLSADRWQCTRRGMEILVHNIYLWPFERGHVQGPQKRDPVTPYHRVGANPTPHGTAVGNPHARGREGLCCTGPCMELQSNQNHCRMVQGKRLQRSAATQLPTGCGAVQAGTGGGQDLRAVAKRFFVGRQAGTKLFSSGSNTAKTSK